MQYLEDQNSEIMFCPEERKEVDEGGFIEVTEVPREVEEEIQLLIDQHEAPLLEEEDLLMAGCNVPFIDPLLNPPPV